MFIRMHLAIIITPLRGWYSPDGMIFFNALISMAAVIAVIVVLAFMSVRLLNEAGSSTDKN